KARKARPFFGRHPWVFEGAVEKVDPGVSPGSIVKVFSFEKEFIAYGLYNPNSKLRVRLYSWDKDLAPDAAMLSERIERAVAFRRDVLKLDDPAGACRLVYSESDGLSGLIVDRYADVLTVQFTSLAMAQFEQPIVETLTALLNPRAVYRRTERGIGELEGLELDDGLVAGDEVTEPVVIVENGIEFLVDPAAGQKTGAFLDQRDNRAAVARYAAGKKVLDAFCYTGGFGLAASILGKAESVVGIDVSGPAIALAQRNADRNGVAIEFFHEEAVPAMQRLRKEGRRFGMVVCDPPKFARTAGAVENAIRGYENVNRVAMELVEPGGVLVTCSCSGHVSPETFLAMLVESAQKNNEQFHLLDRRGQSPDHPVSLFCLETSYLKCFVLHKAA
ncbi:MAG: class I SAM-dependent rRNA methyltransferase, partial [Planctomycetia bacterium]